MTKLEQWNELPQAKRQQLAGQFGIKWFGTTDEQLAFELDTKIPVGFFKEEEAPKPKEKKEEVPVEEVEAKPKKKAKK